MNIDKIYLIRNEGLLVKEDTHKKMGFLVVGPLRVEGGVTPPTTKQKTTFFL